MKAFIFFFVLILVSSCTHLVLRTGYRFDASHQVNGTVTIKKDLRISDSLVKVGEVRLKDTWWALSCNEEKAMEILKKEAHQLRADVICIGKEKRPDLESTCYRCEASFYQFKYPGMVMKSDSAYTAEKLKERKQDDKKKNAQRITAAIVVGLGIGIVLGLLYL